jgi:hypothetical protein
LSGCVEVDPAVLEAQDTIAADQGMIVTPNALQTEECTSGGTDCPSSPAITMPADEAGAAAAAVINFNISMIPVKCITTLC